MASPRPLVCVFLKLPPSHQSVLRIHEIAWNVFLPQMNRLSQALDAAHTTHPLSEVRKFWSEVRRSAAEKVDKLERVAIMNYNTAFAFLRFLDAVRGGRDGSGSYSEFQYSADEAFDEARKAQDVMLEFREEVRIAVGRITTMLSSDDKDVSSFVTESSQSLLELATGIEECNAILEEHRGEVKEVQRQSLDEKDNRLSEEEFQMVREKWQSFKELSEPPAFRWQALWREIRGSEDDQGPTTTSHIPTSPIMSSYSSKSHKILFWRKFFRRISSCFD
ncbi:hypothetical protein AGABI1DRAFT_107031 [Agaricus bisporus var. burnettii JB137-S8]|uniref:Uncharacterized protein n=1 Tax=Agaricus bisporus var. burnettii (strain JB137-S8 / ATCC MYA-4627 / FGSC 10392) TaxID=597362 RepID=K5VYQ9_AGABU|nr:uncharacterized protein AGABI1DRAFT_107031 [Agaricus bisporus var. burnettii JB137-S8]EKM79599.1 hypothetical protein AGABI1DRAFT_107031 [Agaricus bisporus var. burnettii JB137-S8]